MAILGSREIRHIPVFEHFQWKVGTLSTVVPEWKTPVEPRAPILPLNIFTYLLILGKVIDQFPDLPSVTFRLESREYTNLNNSSINYYRTECCLSSQFGKVYLFFYYDCSTTFHSTFFRHWLFHNIPLFHSENITLWYSNIYIFGHKIRRPNSIALNIVLISIRC